MAIDLATAAVGDEWRLRGDGDAVGGGLRAAVAEIHGDAEGVHALHDLAAERAQAGIARLQAAIADQIAIVVRQLNDPDSESMKQIEACEVALNHVGVLKSEDQTQRLVLFRPSNIRVPSHDREQGRIAIGFSLPERDVAD